MLNMLHQLLIVPLNRIKSQPKICPNLQKSDKNQAQLVYPISQRKKERKKEKKVARL